MEVNSRKLRGLEILDMEGPIEQLNSSVYKVRSQSRNDFYHVVRDGAEWKCECPDYDLHRVKCKHIYAVEVWRKLKDEFLAGSISAPISALKAFRCRFCWSEDVVKYGFTRNLSGKKQIYKCKNCGKYFLQVNDEFKWIRGSPKDIALILDLYFKGLSLRKIADHLRQFYGIKLNASTVYRRIQKYVTLLNDYAQVIAPQIGDKWHVDEMMIKCGGRWCWLWNAMDSETRFLLASLVSEGRSIHDARKIFFEAKKAAGKKPETLVTDGLQSYIEAYRKEFYRKQKPRTEHMRLADFEDKVNNNNIERLNGTVRERDKVMRGFNGDRTAQVLHDGLKFYYNFVRPHMGIGNRTPAEKANIDLKLGENRWLSLLKKAAEHKNGNNTASPIVGKLIS